MPIAEFLEFGREPLNNVAMRGVLGRALATCCKTRGRALLCLAAVACLVPLAIRGVNLVLWTVPVFGARLSTVLNPSAVHGLGYFHDTVREVPWSMHVVKLDRARQDLELHSVLGKGRWLGMETVPEQVRALRSEWGRPVAAINGDLYKDHPDYQGDPDGLQIAHGELVSGPSPDRVCFWIDPVGQPHRDDVRSRFEVTWPDGTACAFGLNEARADDAVVLYTAVVGETTRTKDGVDLVLTNTADGLWLPLAVGQTYRARVAEVHPGGNAPLADDVMVLSLGPRLSALLPQLDVGAEVGLSTATVPDLNGVRTAIGGGPTLVVGGQAKEWSGVRLRHPRTAVGWNPESLFLVVVDGRQLRVSAGMTFPELADYMVRLGCEEAMALDGGGSATCWVYGQVMNSPSQGRERPAANALVVMQAGSRRR